jgi:hypothetical protein
MLFSNKIRVSWLLELCNQEKKRERANINEEKEHIRLSSLKADQAAEMLY